MLYGVKPLNIVIINLISNSSIYYIFIIFIIYYCVVVVMITLFRCFSYLRENIQINNCLLQYCVILQKGHSTEWVPFASKTLQKKNHFLPFLKTESSNTHI